MKMISMKKSILFTLATCLLLASKTTCLDGSVMTSLQSREEYSDDTYSESTEDIIEEKQKNLNLEDLKDWGLKNIIKMSPAVHKVASSVANLPLRFGRNFQEARSIKPAANLPLRFGRALAENLSRQALPFSHRLERAPVVQSAIHSLANLPQRFGRSLIFSLPQEIQGNNRFGDLNNLMKREPDDEEESQDNWKFLAQSPY
ncbi:pro-FMRFamide-related neuropeptide VF [Hemicordylus capensis]|uniref:pro-FMRFamide-related neuropeptide VF n=1 Tax=Hemicordylus capensis TaxID=884348 RepID=UPI0023038B95|nr:pro-FMRFamide-related neuropeptide VF [Hemicordylus capensis]